MKKRDAKKQAKIQKITARRAQYEKARRQKLKALKVHQPTIAANIKDEAA